MGTCPSLCHVIIASQTGLGNGQKELPWLPCYGLREAAGRPETLVWLSGFRYSGFRYICVKRQQEFRYAAGIRGNIILLVINDNSLWRHIKIFRMEGIAQELGIIVKIGTGIGFQSLRNLKLDPILDIMDIRRIIRIKVI